MGFSSSSMGSEIVSSSKMQSPAMLHSLILSKSSLGLSLSPKRPHRTSFRRPFPLSWQFTGLRCNLAYPGLRQSSSKSFRWDSKAERSKLVKYSPGFQGSQGVRLLTVKAFSREADEESVKSPAAALRRLLASPGLHQGPACFDALSAKLVEKAGFSFAFTSGFAISAVRLGLPDTGLISYGEMLDQGRQITSAVSIPVIGDGDNGYGNALNVKRTVKGYIQAGFAGVLLEDQVSPKACGHTKGRKVASREDAVMKIKAAVDARKESSSDIVIVARTDARQAVSLEEALWRTQAFAEAGADMLFIDALASKEEMKIFCNVAPGTPKMVNMLEGGKTPILSPGDLEGIGFKLVAYPLSLVGVSICAMQDALLALKSGRLPPPRDLPSFEEIRDIVGFNDYYEEEQHYLTFQHPASEIANADPITRSDLAIDSELLGTSTIKGVGSEQELNEVLQQTAPQNVKETYVVPYVLEETESNNSGNPFSGIWSRTLRVKITGNTGNVKLDVRIPAGFLDGLAKIIPAVTGLNLSVMLDEAAFKLKGNLESGQQLIDINDSRGDRIQVFLE